MHRINGGKDKSRWLSHPASLSVVDQLTLCGVRWSHVDVASWLCPHGYTFNVFSYQRLSDGIDRDRYNAGKCWKGKKYQFSKKVNIFCHLIWKLVFHLKLIRLQLFFLSKDILKQWKKEFLKCSDYCLTSGGITPTKVHMGMPTLKLTNTVSPVSLLYKNNRAKSSLKNWVDKQRFWNLFTLGLAYIYIFMNNTFCLSR